MRKLNLNKQSMINAFNRTKSIRSAAQYLKIDYRTLKLYAKRIRIDDNDVNSPTLFEYYKNAAGKGVKKFIMNKKSPNFIRNIEKILETGEGWEDIDLDKFKSMLVYGNFLPIECNNCGFNERRVIDSNCPLILNFKDKNKTNFLLSNLEFLCYNCYYLFIGNVFTKNQLRHIEHGLGTLTKASMDFDEDWNISEEQMENLISLGLINSDDDGDEDSLIYRK